MQARQTAEDEARRQAAEDEARHRAAEAKKRHQAAEAEKQRQAAMRRNKRDANALATTTRKHHKKSVEKTVRRVQIEQRQKRACMSYMRGAEGSLAVREEVTLRARTDPTCHVRTDVAVALDQAEQSALRRDADRPVGELACEVKDMDAMQKVQSAIGQSIAQGVY